MLTSLRPKTFLVSLAIFLASTLLNLTAAPLNGERFTYTQPDGETFTVRLWGDEFFNWMETDEGQVLIRDLKTNDLAYARLSANGDEYESTGIPFGRKLSANEKAQVQKLKKKIRISRESIKKKVAQGLKDMGRDENGGIELSPPPESSGIQYAPTDGPTPADAADPAQAVRAITGTYRALALLVTFPDKLADVQFTEAQINSRLNDIPYTWNGEVTSTRGYFRAQSHDQFDLSHVTTPYFTAPNNMAWYGDPNKEAKISDLIRIRLEQLKTQGFDFSQLDANGDGIVDCVNLMVPGDFTPTIYGWAGGLTWSGFTDYGLSANCPMTVTFMNSQFMICHELAHAVLKLPDLYSYDGNAGGAEIFCLMSGPWLPHFPNICGPMKYQLGWVTASDVTLSGQTNHTLTVDDTHVVRYVNPNNSMEYFLFEMRGEAGYEAKRDGATQDACPSVGLVIYHVKEDGSNSSSSIFTADNPNCNYSKPYKVLVVEDNPLTTVVPWYDDPSPDSEDAFDTGDVIVDTATPDLAFWSSRGRTIPAGIRITNIQVNASDLTFTIHNDNPPIIAANPSVVQVGSNTTLNVQSSGSWTYAWTKVSGPGTATFGTPAAATTTASFNTIGAYVVRVTLSNGVTQLVSEKTVMVTGGVNDLLGNYKFLPVGNSWHIGWVEYTGSKYQWRNSANVKWDLFPTSDPDVMLTGATPYGANMEFTFVREAGQVVKFIFNDGTYYRCNPICNDQSLVTPKGVGVAATLSASVADNPSASFSYSVVTPPANGTLNGTAPNLTYVPSANFTGVDCFTFKAFDGTNYSNIGTVSITVYGAGDEPQYSLVVLGGNGDGKYRIGQQATITADTAPAEMEFDQWLGDVSALADPTSASTTVTMPAADVLVKASYKSLESLNEYVGYYVLVSPNNDWHYVWIEMVGTQLKWRNKAGASWNLLPTGQTDVLVVDPSSPYYPGLNVTFSRVSGRISQLVFQGGTYVRQSPVAVGASYITTPGVAIATTLTAVDPQSNPMTYTVVTQPMHGTLSGTKPNLTYTPANGYEGRDSFTFKASDASSDSNVAKITITVRSNTAPIVNAGADQEATLVEGTGGGNPVSGAYFEWDAAKDTTIDNKWASSTANTYSWTFDSGTQSPSVVSDARFNSLSKAYAFPAAKDASNTSWDGLGSNQSATFEFVLDVDADNGLLFKSGGTTTGIQFDVSGGALRGYIKNGSTYTVSYPLTTTDKGRFIHAVFVVTNSNTFALYVDGALKQSIAFGASDWSGSGEAALGYSSSATPNGNNVDFTGKLALFRYYRNKAFTPSEVTTNFNALTLGAAAVVNLSGSATDNDVGDVVTAAWSVVSGDSTKVSIADAASPVTTATFIAEGVYTLRLTANDGIAAPVSDDVVITVKNPVSPTTYTVSYIAGANGTITGQSTQTVSAGGSTTAVTAAPNSGYRFKNWSDGSTVNPRTDTNVTANLSVTANFELIPAPTTYTVTYTAGANGTITGQSSQTVNAGGSTSSVTAVPNSGYRFKNWSDGSTANPRIDTNITANISVTAIFELNPPLTAYAGQDQTIFLNGGTDVPWAPNPSELQAWFDASDAGTIVLENGSATAVKQWSDKSGYARHLTQANTSAQPTLGVNEIQMPVNKYMLSADGMMPTGSGGRHVFAVVNNTTTSSVGFISQAHSSWSARTGFAITGEPAVRYSGAMTYNGGALSPSDNLIAVSYDSGSNASTMRYAVNGTNRLGTIVSGDGPLASNSTKLYVGCSYISGLKASKGAANFRELIILTDATLSIDTQQKIEGYLAHKWGLTANLPDGHPYKKAAPTTDGTSATATLNGTVGAPTATWSVVSTQPAGLAVNFANAASAVTTASFIAVGTYTLRLTASDGIAAPVSDDVVITVEESGGATTYTVSYTAGANGTITGQSSQTINAGGSTTAVTAQPNSGYIFTNWSDGSTANPRTDTNVTANISVTANFEVKQPLTSDAGEDQTVALVDTSIPWTPADMSTILWLDATDGSTISADGSNLVSEWRDKRGTGLNLTQATASRQPTTGATINSLNAIDFTGDVMTTATNPFGTTVSDAFVITVHKVDAVANGILFSMTGATSPTGSRWQANAPWGDGSMNFDVNASAPGANRLSAPYGASAGSTVLSSFYSSTTDNVQQVYKNGSLLAGDSTGASANTVSGLSIGGVGSTCQNTTIGEMIVINGTVSVDDRQNLEGYLAHKWGLADNLPEGHPSKGAAPTTGGGTAAIVTLEGSVGDPYGSTPTATWSVVSTQPAGLSVEFADPSSPGTSASFTAAGIYTLRLTATSGAAAPVSDQVVITVESEPSAQYAAWIGDQGVLAEAALMDDADGDGKGNLMEFAFGTNPSAMDMGPLAVDGSRRGDPKLMKEEGGGFALYYIRRADHGKSGSVIYTTYFSSDLTTFTPSSAGLEVVDSAGVGYELVKVPFPPGAKFGYVKLEAAP